MTSKIVLGKHLLPRPRIVIVVTSGRINGLSGVFQKEGSALMKWVGRVHLHAWHSGRDIGKLP